jgi:hypothetical protein
MNEKQQQLTFDKGITNVPSDALCSDNALAESVGMVYVDGEHKVIQKPEISTSSMTGSPITIIYIHKFNDIERFIGYNSSNQLYWSVKSSTTLVLNPLNYTFNTSIKVSSVGKTLIITDNDGIHYFLLKGNAYKALGDIPAPNVEMFLLNHDTANSVNCEQSYEGISGDGGGMIKQAEYNDMIVGLYSKCKVLIAQNKAFCEPFFARVALELYDGTYTLMSPPIMLFPSITDNHYVEMISDNKHCKMVVEYCRLQFRNKSYYDENNISETQYYTDWEDIVKDIVIFVTEPVSIYDTISDQPDMTSLGQRVWWNAITSTTIPEKSIYKYRDSIIPSGPNINAYTVLKKKNISEIEDDLCSQSVFYKLCSIGRYAHGYSRDISTRTKSHTLENLTTQEQLEVDDYFSHSKMLPSFIYTYNSRLNIANVKRSIFEGFGSFLPYDNDDAANYNFYVTIKTESGDKIVRHTENNSVQKQGIWFFYPDSRASHITIFKQTDTSSSDVGLKILDEDLTEHPGLNGAYYFKGLPSDYEPETGVSDTAPTVNNTPELLPNYIITSEVNNPWVFRAEGYYKVGTGKILAISSITQALSEGQFGQFPLLVFSESGIWALSVASTGYYSSIQPMSREVSNDPACIVQTDGAVFFTSKKGLMVVAGSQVKCVSEQLSGKTNVFKDGSNNSLVIDLGNFSDYLKNAFIAYDYRDSLLWIFNTAYTTCYIYSMKTGTFSKFTPTTKITNVVNNYPDYLLQAGTTIYSLTGRHDINASAEQSNTYAAAMLTRPLKLEDALALTSIMQVKHIHDMNKNATLTLRIFASNNLKNWVELHSLRGTPWKYYRFRYDFANLKATDRFAGTMLITQERRTNKLR